MARVTRRTFLRTTGIAGSTLLLSGLPYTNRLALGQQPAACIR